jgi:hypothetical protein
MTWYQIWIQATTRPSHITYKNILTWMPKDLRTPVLWVFMSSWIGFGLSYNVYRIAQNQYDSRFVICSALFGGLGVLGLGFYTLVTQFVAKLLGGSGTFGLLFRVLASAVSPLVILIGVVGALSNVMPLLSAGTTLIWIYQMVLSVLITQAVNDFTLDKAIFSNLLVIVLEILNFLV